jgi:hypothetical protein
MKRSVVFLFVVAIAATVGSVQAQCRGGGGGGGRSPGGGGSMAGGSMGAALLTSPGSWAYDQMLGQAMQRQIAQQQYLKAQAEQQRRAESLVRRQYWAAQRREQRAKSAAAVSPGIAAANSRPNSMAMSLDFSPSPR